jgi:heme-degrading monooxygenase HmoA
MFSVIFEVRPNDGQKDEYLELAAGLKPILESMDGFIAVERFDSTLRPGWILSHSSWRDENSLIRWRTQGDHHAVQTRGRFRIFRDYHLRVGEVIADSDPGHAPLARQRLDQTEVGAASEVTLTEITPAEGAAFATGADPLLAQLGLDPGRDGVVEHDVFASIYHPGKLMLLAGWSSTEAAARWSPAKIDSVAKLRHRRVRIVRDYGRFDRREAPQFYPDVEGRPSYADPAR